MLAEGLVVNKFLQNDNIEYEFLKGTVELWVGERDTTFFFFLKAIKERPWKEME